MIDAATTLATVSTLNRYFRLLDERSFDVERFAEVFAADGVVHRPNGTSMVGPDAIVASHRTSFARFSATQHQLTGHDVEPAGAGVRIRANLVAMHLWAGSAAHGVIAGPDDFFLAGAVITATLTSTPAGWRIAELVNTNVWKAGSGFANMAATPGSP